MKLGQFLESWRIVQAENRLHRIVLLGLIVTNGLSALAALRTERAVVLVPPNLDKEVEITRNTASSELKESWGLYLAELLGNVTPTNAAHRQGHHPITLSRTLPVGDGCTV